MRFLECFQLTGKILHGNNYLWWILKKSSVYRMQRFIYFQILCYVSDTNIKYCWGRKLSWFKDSPQYRTLDTIDGEPMEFRAEYFPKTHHIAAHRKSPRVHDQNGRRTNYLHVDVQWHHMGIWRQWTWCIANATLVTSFAYRFPAGRWSILGPGSEKKWYSTYNDRPQGEWDRVAELMMIKFRESGHPVFRATSPLSRGTLKSKGRGKLSIHFCADEGTIETIFRTIISVNQLSIFGAVSDVFDERSACQARTARPVLAGQSGPLFELARLLITTPTPSTEVPAQEILLQKYQERIGQAITPKSCD